MVFELLAALVQPSQLQRSEVDVPKPIADFFEADVFTSEGVRDADPALLPADAAVAADQPDFKVSRVFEGRELPGELAPRRTIERRRGLLAEGFVRTVSARVMRGVGLLITLKKPEHATNTESTL